MKIQDFKEKHGDLEHYLEQIYQSNKEAVNVRKVVIETPVPLINAKIKLHDSQLDLLAKGENQTIYQVSNILMIMELNLKLTMKFQ